MKKLFLTLFFAAGIFMIGSQTELLFGKRLFLDEPRVHKIQKGEYLSKLAQQYYDDPQRWRELALINRAPNPNHVEVGEEILVPAANVAIEINRARTITQVNALVSGQQKLAVRESSPSMTNGAQPATPSSEVATGTGAQESPAPLVTEPAPIIEETPAPVANENSFPWFWIALGVAILAIVGGLVIYRRRQLAEQKVDVEMKKRDNSFESLRSRRQYGENMPAKSQASEEKAESAEAKEKGSGADDFRSRRRYGESSVATT